MDNEQITDGERMESLTAGIDTWLMYHESVGSGILPYTAGGPSHSRGTGSLPEYHIPDGREGHDYRQDIGGGSSQEEQE